MDNLTRIVHDPESTRRRILDAAFLDMYHNGYQGMRLDNVLAATGLTKGALYHHFPNKRALGYTVVDEVILPSVEALWLTPLKSAADPLQTLIGIIERLTDSGTPETIQYGCPANNLAQEMSPLDEGFRKRLDYIFRIWHDVTEDALQRAQHQERLRADVDCDATATFVLAALEGCIGMAKNAQSGEQLRICNRVLVDYLCSLQA